MKFKKIESSFIFYDYETFGIDTALDKPAQFACIKTDINLNIISDPQYFYCFPSDDYMPNPDSVLITGITPQYTQKHGTNECNFSKRIYDIFTKYNTCIIGYNNIHFDDEITRNIFYRNFFDPYEWSWKNGNSRWDLINVLRACYALRPNGIKWPKNKFGHTSFKLSDLTKINNIDHINAHDALSDVYATIEMAKIVKKKQPKLFDFYFLNRKTRQVAKMIDLKKFKPIIYVSNIFGINRYNMSFILPIAHHKNNKNILISIDLYKNVEELILFCKKISFDNFSIKKLFNLGVVLLHLNRCPILAPIQIIRKQDYSRLNCNIDSYESKICIIKKNKNFVKNIQDLLLKENVFDNSSNVDQQMYNSFFGINDRNSIKKIRNTHPIFLKNLNINFYDARLKMLFFRYRARNFFNILNNSEKKIWLKYCLTILNPSSLKKYESTIRCLIDKHDDNIKKVIILKKLLNYVFQKYKNLLQENINLK